jgi:hypothetical protein
MRDLVAGIMAVGLLLFAASLATTLTVARRRRRRARESEGAKGRRLIAEIPGGDDLILVSEDEACFYYGERVVDKGTITAGRVLINGSPIAAVISTRHVTRPETHATSFEDRPEGIARDRWDVAIETVAGTVLVECGSIRERVSQELARAVFDAVRRAVER